MEKICLYEGRCIVGSEPLLSHVCIAPRLAVLIELRHELILEIYYSFLLQNSS